jgi:hypothetical protein
LAAGEMVSLPDRVADIEADELEEHLRGFGYLE